MIIHVKPAGRIMIIVFWGSEPFESCIRTNRPLNQGIALSWNIWKLLLLTCD